MSHRVVTLVVVLVATLLAGPALPASAAAPPAPASPPTVTGDPVFHGRLVAAPGTWEPADGLTYTYQWLRGDRAIPAATARRYRPGLDDLGSRLSVVVTATDGSGQTGVAGSDRTSRVRRAELVVRQRPEVTGTRRYTHRLRADRGEWKQRRVATSFRWLRDGKPIAGARHRRHRLDHRDVGHHVRVRVTARKAGYRVARVTSRRGPEVGHRVPPRRTVTYRIETRGRITADMGTFRRQVAETFADPRGWRSAGVVLRRVARGGDFSVVLAEASRVPRFSPVCSAQWSCRVGRYVIINQLRWQHASPSWNRAQRSLRSYRHMVVNHETGHWLGHDHRGCPGRGRPAPVMMQQSKGLAGCRHNAWPLPSELWTR